MPILDSLKLRARELAGKASVSAREAASAAFSKVKESSKGQKAAGDDYIVALDIGTEFVKALIGKMNEDDGTVEIVGVGRAHQSLSDMQAGAISDIASVVQNCDEALHEAEQQAGVSVRRAVIGIAGELVKGTTSTIRVARQTPAKPLD